MIKKKKGFTLIELIAVLVIMAIIALIVTPLVMSIIRKAKISARKRSVDAYGRSVELAIASYLLDTGTFPTNEQLPNLQIEYSGSTVVCNVMAMKENGGLYLSECKVNNVDVKDDSTEDGWYHYGTRDLTNEEYVDMYGLALKNASVAYYEENGTPVEDYRTLTIDYKGKPVACDVTVNYDGTIYMTKCKVNKVDVTSVTEEDGYYHYGSLYAVNFLLSKRNKVDVANYTDGNIHEMYTFNHEITEQMPALTDYRYIGSDPYNFVYFNGGQIWRIVGIFTVDDGNGNMEKRIKIENNSFIGSRWDSSNNNDWAYADLNAYFNNSYFFDDISLSMMANTKYYLGGVNTYMDGESIYKLERKKVSPKYGFYNWTGLVGLIYSSDYCFTYALGVDDICYNNINKCHDGSPNSSWLYNQIYDSRYKHTMWTITPYLGDFRYVNTIKYNGYVSGSLASMKGIYSDNYVASPVTYIKPDVKIVSGDGSEQSPYQLSL